jgi:hypothetical protein
VAGIRPGRVQRRDGEPIASISPIRALIPRRLSDIPAADSLATWPSAAHVRVGTETSPAEPNRTRTTGAARQLPLPTCRAFLRRSVTRSSP